MIPSWLLVKAALQRTEVVFIYFRPSEKHLALQVREDAAADGAWTRLEDDYVEFRLNAPSWDKAP